MSDPVTSSEPVERSAEWGAAIGRAVVALLAGDEPGHVADAASGTLTQESTTRVSVALEALVSATMPAPASAPTSHPEA